MEPLLSFVLSMAPILLIILVQQPHLFMRAAAQSNQLKAPFSMTPTQRLTTSSGIFAFGFCNVDPSLHPSQLLLAIWFDFGASNCSNKRVVWFARDPNSNQAVIATDQAALTLHGSNSWISLVDGQRTLWISSQQQFGSTTLMLLDSGNLQLLYTSGGGVSWQSFDHPTHALLPGQTLTHRPGTYLLSKDTDMDFSPGRFALVVQGDANIVLYMRNLDQISSLDGEAGDPIWAEGSWRNAHVPTIILDNSGNLFFNDSVNGYKNLTMQRPPNSADSYYHYAALDADGIVRVYAHQRNNTDGTAWDVVSFFAQGYGCGWKTKSNETMCGPNAYCKVSSLKEQRVSCECPDGYVFVDEQSRYRGCRTNFTSSLVLSSPGNDKLISRKWLYLIIAILGTSLLVTVVRKLYQCYSSKKAKRRSLLAGLRTFTYRELKQATNGFKELLGKGGFGEVHKGKLRHLQPPHVAVKTLIQWKSERDFENEVRSIGHIHHKNLVRMIGYCKQGAHRMLVFEYMPGGTLADFIFASERPCWSFLAEAAVGIARGLEYLHEGCKSRIIHCDIKPDNILFDDKHTPRITDFGIAKLLGDQKTQHTITTVAGTRAYLAPEWFHGEGRVDSKVDVYSFGVVLLEMICCNKSSVLIEESSSSSSDSQEAGTLSSLRAWAESLIRSGRAEQLVQGEREALDHMESVERFARVSIWCLQQDPSIRPHMRKVVQMLENTVEVDSLPDPPSFSPAILIPTPTSSGTLHSSSTVHALQVD